MLLDGKVAIVTGAAQGIGRACAVRLAQRGRQSRAVRRQRRGGQSARARDRQGRRGGTLRACDVAKPADVGERRRRRLNAYGRIDVLVNNAGVVDDAPFLDLPIEELDRMLGINLRGAFLMGAGRRAPDGQARRARRRAHAAGRRHRQHELGQRRFALPDHVAYSISKGGISQLTKAMAIALAPHGIRVNAVGPGTIETPLLEGVIKDKAFRAKVLSRTPLGRFGQPDEIAAIVAWLASEEASYVTGTTVYADGGRLPLNYVVPVPEEG